VPTLKNRALRIDTEASGFIYQYEVCSGFIFKKCRIVTERYDFTNEETRVKLKDMGFKLKVTD
jgi:hypothetical protein